MSALRRMLKTAAAVRKQAPVVAGTCAPYWLSRGPRASL